MEPQFRTSFVPKKPVSAPSEQRKRRRTSPGLIMILTLIVFLATATLAIGTFLYQEFLGNSIARKSQELEQARASFEPALIQELTRLDKRLDTAGTLLDSHIALSQFFSFLEESTLQSVQFRDFRFNILPDGSVSLLMNGRARSFSAVALQSDVFGESEFIRSPIFENFNVDDQGNVVFSLTAFIDSQLLSYQVAGSEQGSFPVSDEQETTEAADEPLSDEERATTSEESSLEAESTDAQ